MTTKEHIHYWLCEPPNGEFSVAVCKHCKEETKFRNSPERINTWNSSFSKANGGKGHGMSKEQLTKKTLADGREMPDLPRTLESARTKKEKSDAKQSTAKRT